MSFQLNLHYFESEFFENYDARISFVNANSRGDSIGLFKIMFRFGSLLPMHIGFYGDRIHCKGLKQLENSLEKLFAAEFKITIEQFKEVRREGD